MRNIAFVSRNQVKVITYRKLESRTEVPPFCNDRNHADLQVTTSIMPLYTAFLHGIALFLNLLFINIVDQRETFLIESVDKPQDLLVLLVDESSSDSSWIEWNSIRNINSFFSYFGVFIFIIIQYIEINWLNACKIYVDLWTISSFIIKWIENIKFTKIVLRYDSYCT